MGFVDQLMTMVKNSSEEEAGFEIVSSTPGQPEAVELDMSTPIFEDVDEWLRETWMMFHGTNTR